jgi:DNA polymerase III subunit delta
MSRLTRHQLEASLKEGRTAPLYLLIGAEAYLRDEAARAIADAGLGDTFLREFNESRFSLIATSALDAIKAAEECVTLRDGIQQLSIISERKIVHIKDFGKLREKDEEALIRYVENPRISSIVIFIAPDLDKRKKLTKALLDKCTIVEFPPVTVGEAKAWAKAHLKQLRVSADEKTLNDIIALVGTDIQTLCFELDKLATAAVETGCIRAEMVDQLIDRSRELSNFDLGDQLIAGDQRRALETLHRLLEDNVPPVLLLGLIAGNYHRLALAKEFLKRGARDEVYRLIYGPPAKRDAFMNTLQRSDATKIARGIKLIADADLAIKTSLAGGGPKGARLQLEMLVCELSGS